MPVTSYTNLLTSGAKFVSRKSCRGCGKPLEVWQRGRRTFIYEHHGPLLREHLKRYCRRPPRGPGSLLGGMRRHPSARMLVPQHPTHLSIPLPALTPQERERRRWRGQNGERLTWEQVYGAARAREMKLRQARARG